MAEDSEKLYTLRKTIKKLAGFRGSGTQLISVYIPAGSAVHDMSNKLREELSQASNIKSKQTRTNVMDALEKIIGHLKIFKKAPDNGLAAFCGNISDNPAKTDIELFSLEPPQPLRVGIYRCDSSFFLEPLERMLETRDAYGVVVLDGREATLAIVKGTEINIVKKMNSLAHAKIKVGGQCLAAGSMIVRSDGEIVNIEDFNKENGIVGLDFNSSKTIPMAASDFFITPAKHSFIIRTKAPTYEIRATPYHRFFVLSEFGIKEKFAKDLDCRDRVLIAKKINTDSKRIETGFIPKTRMVLDNDERAKLKRARVGLDLSQTEVAKRIGVSQMVISHLESGKQNLIKENLKKIYSLYGLKFDEKRFERQILRFPKYWNEDLARLFGIICGDGSRDHARISIYEGSKELADDYCRLIRRAIGIVPKVYSVDKTHQKGSFARKPYYEIRINSAQFVEAIDQIAPGIVSTTRRDIPKELGKCAENIVAAFLSGLYDAEGYLRDRKQGGYVDIAMVEKKLLKKIQLLLLRLGIISSFSEKNVSGRRQWSVSITDGNAIRLFSQKIGFCRKDKKVIMEGFSKTRIPRQYSDQVPVDGREIFKLAQELGLKTSDFHAASFFFRNLRPIGREAFSRKILPVFEKHRNSRRGKQIYGRLLELYNSDFTVANIKEKILLKGKEEFYDLTIPVHSNFVADGFIVHNSQARYQRLIEESIEKYYKRVSESMDKYFLNKVKGVMVGGPGPTKEFFLKAKDFNYQHKIIGPVDTGYTDEYGVREVLAKSESLLEAQEAIVEKKLVDRFIKAVVSDGLAIYGEKQVREAILVKQADHVLLSEGLEHIKGTYECTQCKETFDKVFREKPPEKIECKCGGEGRLKDQVPLLDDLADLAKANDMKVDIVSTNTTEGAQFLSGFGGIGAFLRYKIR